MKELTNRLNVSCNSTEIKLETQKQNVTPEWINTLKKRTKSLFSVVVIRGDILMVLRTLH